MASNRQSKQKKILNSKPERVDDQTDFMDLQKALNNFKTKSQNINEAYPNVLLAPMPIISEYQKSYEELEAKMKPVVARILEYNKQQKELDDVISSKGYISTEKQLVTMMAKYEHLQSQMKILQSEIMLGEELRNKERKIKENPKIPFCLVSQFQDLINEVESNLKHFQLKTESKTSYNGLKTNEDAVSELECSICLTVPKPDVHVYSCLEQHLICNECKPNNLTKCPVCRQCFTKNPPLRNRLAEKIIRRLN